MSEAVVDAQLAALHTRFAAVGQGHVTTWISELTLAHKRSLLADLNEIRVEKIAEDWETVQEQLVAAEAEPPPVTPFTNVAVLDKQDPATRERWMARGLELLAQGKVAALLMAGGQGTRLGSLAPKGCFDIGLLSHKSLFQLQAERLQRLRVLASNAAKVPLDSVHIRWYIMTSIITHAATVIFFRTHEFFGLPEQDCVFFQQSELPALDDKGLIIMERKDKVSMAPNGNGGIFEGLKRQGALEDMKKHGIEYIHVYGVDNVLAKVADPMFIGFGALSGADCANKVVLKEDPAEKVGVMCLRDGKPSVVEYSELSAEMAQARDASGQLVYSAGNIVQHFFTIGFLEAHATDPLSYHIAHKVIPYVDVATGHLVSHPAKPNGIKLEMFVFDAFERADNMQCLAVSRAEEFSPVKNAPLAHDTKDTPLTARRDVSELHCSMLQKAGATLVNKLDADSAALAAGLGEVKCECEISPLVSYAGEGLAKFVKGKTITLPIQITPHNIEKL